MRRKNSQQARLACLALLGAAAACAWQQPASPLIYSYPINGNAYAIAVDAAGYAYIAGTTQSPDFVTTPGAFLSQSDAGQCPVQPTACPAAFVIKLDPTGTRLVYSTLLGVGDARGIAIDAAGNAYITGQAANNYPTTPGSPYTGKTGAFITKLNSTGTALVYSMILGESSWGNAVTVNAHGSAIAAGETHDPSFPSTFRAGSSAPSAFIVQVKPDGSGLVYSTLLGGSAPQHVAAVALDAAGAVYAAGATNSPDFPVTDGSPPGATANSRAFVVKLNSDGGLASSTLLGGSEPWFATAIAIGATGAVWIALDQTSSSSVARATPFGVSPGRPMPGVRIARLAVDAAGNHFVLGTSATAPVSGNAIARCGGARAYLAEWTVDGKVPFATSLPGGGADLALGPAGSLLVAGAAAVKLVPAPAPLLDSVPCPIPVVWDYDGMGQNVVAPGAIARIEGVNLGPVAGAGASLDGAGRLATTLAGVQVLLDDLPAPLLEVEAQRIWFIAPFALAGKQTAALRVLNNGVASDTFAVDVRPVAPAILRAQLGPPQGASIPLVFNEDLTVNSAAHPARAGSVLTFFATGVGALDPPMPDGALGTAPLSRVANPLQVYIGTESNPGEVLYAGAAPGLPAGVVQVNVRVNTLPPHEGALSLGLVVNGVTIHALAGVWFQ